MSRNPLSNSRGENTSAEFGFLRTLISVRKAEKPDALLVCFDPVGKSFRHEMEPSYKATRKKMPDDLRDSIDRLLEGLEFAGLSWLRREGFEADDLMASAATEAESLGWDVLLLTSDKDLCQLVSDRVTVLRPAKSGQAPLRMDHDQVVETFGVAPDRILDLLALTGDSSDNIQGVRGLGPKGAVGLINEHGDLDSVLAAVPHIARPAMRKKLEEGRESALQARDLVRLRSDLLEGSDPADWAVKTGNPTALKDWLASEGFQSLVSELSGASDEKEECSYRLVRDDSSLEEMVREMKTAGRFAVDTETTSLDVSVADLVGISFCAQEGKAWYLPVDGLATLPALPLRSLQEKLGPLLSDNQALKIFHNLKFDAAILARHGLTPSEPVLDSMLVSYCLNPSRRSHSLDRLVLEEFGHEMIPYEALFDRKDKVKDIRQLPLEELSNYAAEDADYTFRLANRLEPLLDPSNTGRILREVELPLLPVLMRMEERGVLLDVDHLSDLSESMAGDISALEAKIWALAGSEFVIGSPRQVAQVLFEELGLPRGRKTKTGYSTDESVLGDLAAEHEIAGLILEWRELTKLKSTYVDALPAVSRAESGRIHTSFNQVVTATGRLSSSNPNLQNIPIRSAAGREVRKAFIAGEGMRLVSFDYSQIELRIMAELSGDAELLAAFAAGGDIHSQTAARLLGCSEDEIDRERRDQAKMVNYGLLYGMGARGLASRLGMALEEAQEFIDSYFAAFPAVRLWIDETLARVRREGFAETLLGRRRPIAEINSNNRRLRTYAERAAINHPVQGTAADLMKLAMIRVDAKLQASGLQAKMLLQVHDELLLEVPSDQVDETAHLVLGIMMNVGDFPTPLAVDWGSGKDWLEAH